VGTDAFVASPIRHDTKRKRVAFSSEQPLDV